MKYQAMLKRKGGLSLTVQGELILVINPGSTSTKVAVFAGEERLFGKTYDHAAEWLAGGATILEQLPGRAECVRQGLRDSGVDPQHLAAVACRGGRFRPLPSGTYLVNERMLDDARTGRQGFHASNLACLIGHEIAKELGIPAYVVDPVSVDELSPVARVSGLPQLERFSLSHALNLKAVARKAAAQLGKPYDQANLIVAHLGGGGSIGMHHGGRMVDIYNCDVEGPFALERSGSLPTTSLVELCFSGKYSKEEVLKLLSGQGGVYAHLGTRDLREVEARARSGDERATLLMEAMIYLFAKYIASLAPVVDGQIDAVVLTGGAMNSQWLREGITKRVAFLAPVLVYPGGMEEEALAAGALRVLRQEEAPLTY
jgi:butyrate kinase